MDDPTSQLQQQDQWSAAAAAENKSRQLSRANSPLPHSSSPHPHFHDPSEDSLSVDPAQLSNPTVNNLSFSTADSPLDAGNQSSAAGATDQLSFATSPYLGASNPDHALGSGQPESNQQHFSNSFEESFITQLKSQGTEDFSSLLHSDFTIYPSSSGAAANQPLDLSLLDPQFDSKSPQQQSVNPADLSKMTAIHSHSPPHLVPPDSHASPRPGSPASSPGAYFTPQHSRHTSLDPITAAYFNQQQQQQHQHQIQDWQGLLGGPAFQGHRRAPSEHSDVSSVAHSPYLGHESFEAVEGNHSPMLNPQTDPTMYDNAFGIESFTISDASQHQGISPGHSPYISPRLVPQQQQQHPIDLPAEAFHLTHVNTQLGPSPSDPYNTSATSKLENSPHPTLPSHNSPSDMGQAAQMAPPSINVEFAPPSRTSSFGPAFDGDQDTLSPPSRSRGRSKSDPFGHTPPVARPRSASSSAGPPSPASQAQYNLSPFPLSTPTSREPSPSGKPRRLSTSSLDGRNYILDLADPQRAGSTSSDSKGRIQKHPATFQCHLCPKRFTRAYNLRSHLRTHTDERPFVCTVCGKAFARQHDRKRHEGLHSGEKKFVCRGDLGHGGHWGCGRRFARADALGRHFRSEAGRVCIKPLLDEEALERERQYGAQQEQVAGHLQPIPQPLTVHGVDGQQAGFTLPAALLAQYPALQNLQWDQLNSQQADDGSDLGGGNGGRSSFDASSGGEYGFGDEDDGGMNNGFVGGGAPGMPQQGGVQHQHHPQDPQQQHHLMGVNPAAGATWSPQPSHGWPSEYGAPR